MAATYPAHSPQRQNYVAAIVTENLHVLSPRMRIWAREEQDNYSISLRLWVRLEQSDAADWQHKLWLKVTILPSECENMRRKQWALLMNRTGFSCLSGSQDVHSHKALTLSHLPPVTHTKHAGRHGFQGDREAPFLDDSSECGDGGH